MLQTFSHSLKNARVHQSTISLLHFCIDNWKKPDFRLKLPIHPSLNNNHVECQELKTLFMCQVCQRFFLNTKDTRNHIQNTHHIPKEVQNKMTSLSAIEIPLRTTSGMYYGWDFQLETRVNSSEYSKFRVFFGRVLEGFLIYEFERVEFYLKFPSNLQVLPG